MEKKQPENKSLFTISISEKRTAYEKKTTSTFKDKEGEVFYEPKDEEIEHLKATVDALDIGKVIDVIYKRK